MTDLDELTSKIIPILKEAGVSKSALFGSYARGEQTPSSDIDLLVELPSGSSLLTLIALERQLKNTLGKNIDLVTYNSISPKLKQSIQQDQITIV